MRNSELGKQNNVLEYVLEDGPPAESVALTLKDAKLSRITMPVSIEQIEMIS